MASRQVFSFHIKISKLKGSLGNVVWSEDPNVSVLACLVELVGSRSAWAFVLWTVLYCVQDYEKSCVEFAIEARNSCLLSLPFRARKHGWFLKGEREH